MRKNSENLQASVRTDISTNTAVIDAAQFDVIHSDIDKIEFNERQLSVINLSDGWHSCVAPAGAGKTEILTERVSRALESGQSPSSIICLTFTNRAAFSMKQRVRERVGKIADQIFVGNFHGFAMNYLQASGGETQIRELAPPNLQDSLWAHSLEKVVERLKSMSSNTISDYLESDLAALPNLDLKLSRTLVNSPSRITTVLGFLSPERSFESWNLHGLYRLLLPLFRIPPEKINSDYVYFVRERLPVFDKQLHEDHVPVAVALTHAIYRVYTEQKQILGVMDYDDLLVECLVKLTTTTFEGAGRERFSWCQVDETQDLSPIQWLLVNALVEPDAHVVLFGDSRQSIYRFLGASVELTEAKLGDSRIELITNYRSPKNLIDLANDFSTQNFGQATLSKPHKPPEPDALLHIKAPDENELIHILCQTAQKINCAEEKVAILCPTNKGVSAYSKRLSELGIDHFKVGDPDLFASKAALDFVAFAKVFQARHSRLSWARLVYLFADPKSLKYSSRTANTPMCKAVEFVNSLELLGGRMSDYVLGGAASQSALTSFSLLAGQRAIYFDTETTGLSSDSDIVQISGVEIGQLTNKELDLYCNTLQDLSESSEIHGITSQVLKCKGRDIASQLHDFIEYVDSAPLIAHNHLFDDRMMRANLARSAPALLNSYRAIDSYCTLDISRRLYPNLRSHKLEYLLKYFELNGVNSHNAIDDVRAGRNLFDFLQIAAFERAEDVDEFVVSNSDVIDSFSKNFGPLYQTVQEAIANREIWTFTEFIDVFFNYITTLPRYEVDNSKILELRRKLGTFVDERYEAMPLEDLLQQELPFDSAAKEADLITDKDVLIVSTIHRAKGLEFDNVIMANMVDGVVPGFFLESSHYKALTPIAERERLSLIQEQCRLTYVGLTRAKRQLIIGSYKQAYGYRKDICPFLKPLMHRFINKEYSRFGNARKSSL